MKKLFRNIFCIVLTATVIFSAFSAFAFSGKWIKSGERWWYRHSDGTYTTDGWEKINNKWYYFDGDGWMKTGWLKSKGSWYYLEKSGAMCTGWHNEQKNGKLVTYYLNANGKMKTGWLSNDGKWYFFENNGSMARCKWAGSYYLGYDGVWVEDPGVHIDKAIESINVKYFEGVPSNYTESTTTDEKMIALFQRYLSKCSYQEGADEQLVGGSGYKFTISYTDGTEESGTVLINSNSFFCNQMYYSFDAAFAASFFETIYNG